MSDIASWCYVDLFDILREVPLNCFHLTKFQHHWCPALQLILVWLQVQHSHLASLHPGYWTLREGRLCSLTNCFCPPTDMSSLCDSSPLHTSALAFSLCSPLFSLPACLPAAALAVPALSQFQVLWGVRDWAASQWLQHPPSSSCRYCTPTRYWQGETTHSSAIHLTPSFL